MSDTTSELLNLVDGVEELAAQQTEKAREAYRGLLLRLAQDRPKKGDTPMAINGLLRDVGRMAPEFRADVDEVMGLFRLAEEARGLSELRTVDQEAAEALLAGQEEHKRVVKEADARLNALERARDDTSRRLYSAADAQRALLQRLGLEAGYERKLDALATAQARLADFEDDDADAASAREEVERRCAEVWEIWERALALQDHDPFRVEPSQQAAPPLRVEGCEWTQVDSNE